MTAGEIAGRLFLPLVVALAVRFFWKTRDEDIAKDKEVFKQWARRPSSWDEWISILSILGFAVMLFYFATFAGHKH